MSLSEARKAAVALVVAVIAALAFIIDFDPSFTEAVIVLTGAVFGVIGVWASKNHTPDDLQKAVTALTGSALSVVGYFVVVNPDTAGKIEALAAALVAVVGVYWARNAPAVEATTYRQRDPQL